VLPKENNRPTVENSTNRVTLLLNQDLAGSAINPAPKKNYLTISFNKFQSFFCLGNQQQRFIHRINSPESRATNRVHEIEPKM
jgi:hypothetical protein